MGSLARSVAATPEIDQIARSAIEETELPQDQKLTTPKETFQVQIVDYKPEYQPVFRALNEEWIAGYFKMESGDYKVLDHPKEYILDKGGYILVALYNNEPVGVCALMKLNDPDYDYEIAKLAVSAKAQGKRIGILLSEAIIEKAKQVGASKLYIQSNRRLGAAINLYSKLGFTEITGRPVDYERADIQMELSL